MNMINNDQTHFMKVDPQNRRQLTNRLYVHDMNRFLQAYFSIGKYKRTLEQFKNEAGIIFNNQDNEFNQAKLFVQLINKGLYYSTFQKYLLNLNEEQEVHCVDKPVECLVMRFQLDIPETEETFKFIVQNNHIICYTRNGNAYVYQLQDNQIKHIAILNDIIQMEAIPARNDLIVLASKNPFNSIVPVSNISTDNDNDKNYLYVYNIQEQCVSTFVETTETQFSLLTNEILLGNIFLDSIYLKHSDYIVRPLPGTGKIVTMEPNNIATPYPKTNQQRYVLRFEEYLVYIMTSDQSQVYKIDLKFIQTKNNIRVSEIYNVFYPQNNVIVVQDQDDNVYKFSLLTFYDTNQYKVNLDYILSFNKKLKKVITNQENYLLLDNIVYSPRGQAVSVLEEIQDVLSYKDGFIRLSKDGILQLITLEQLCQSQSSINNTQKQLNVGATGKICICNKDIYILTNTHTVVYIEGCLDHIK